MSSKVWAGLLVCASLCLASRPTVAQTQFGRFGPTGAQVAGAAVGAAAVITIIVYFSIPKQKTIEGCVQSNNGASVLTDDRDHRTYELLSNKVEVNPSHRLKLKGKRRKDKSGTWRLDVKKLVKDEGPCGA